MIYVKSGACNYSSLDAVIVSTVEIKKLFYLLFPSLNSFQS